MEPIIIKLGGVVVSVVYQNSNKKCEQKNQDANENKKQYLGQARQRLPNESLCLLVCEEIKKPRSPNVSTKSVTKTKTNHRSKGRPYLQVSSLPNLEGYESDEQCYANAATNQSGDKCDFW